MRKKRRKLVVQLLAVLVVLMIPTLLMMGNRAYKSFFDIYLDEQGEALRSAAHILKADIQKYENFEWLTRYWEDNADNLDIVYDDQDYVDEKIIDFAVRHPGLTLENMSHEELMSLPEADQKEYAEIAYMAGILDFDRVKAEYGLKYLYMVHLNSPEEQTFILTGKVDGETRGTGDKDIYMLGMKTDPKFPKHEVLKDTYETGNEQKELENRGMKRNSSRHYNVYVPMDIEEGSYILVTALDARAVEKRLMWKLLSIEGEAFLLLLLCLAILGGCIYWLVLHPISHLQKGISCFSNDKDATKLNENINKIKSWNEVGDLAREVADMANEIVAHTEEVVALTAQQERIGAELSIATRIQAALLPKIEPEFAGRSEFDLYAKMDPAKEVGGDFFDFFDIDDDHIGLVMADVSGKGIPAAMFMLVSMVYIRNCAKRIESPAAVLQEVNNLLCEKNEAEMFVSVWLAEIELSTGKLVSANAGHEYPAIARKGEKFELWKDRHGLVLAAMPGAKYQDCTLTLEKGDIIFTYTDGVAEATDSDNRLYGTDRMLEALSRNTDLSMEEMLRQLRADVDAFVGEAPQFDDLTMMGFRYLGK